MTTIELIAKDQGLTAEEKPVVASGNQNTVVIEIDYSNEWDGYAKSAVFFTENNPTAYEVAVENNKCIIPHEVLADVTKLYIGLRGVKEDEVKASSLVKYNVVKGAPVGEGTAVDATPTPYQQVLSRTESLQGQINEIVIEATGSGDASAEVAQARVPEYGSEKFPTLQARLNASDAAIKAVANEIEQAKEPGEYGTGYSSLQERFKANEDGVGLLAGEIGRAKEAPDGTMYPTLKERLDADKESNKTDILSVSERVAALEIFADIVPLYTNLLPTATDTDRTTIYEGKGYKTETRLSSSGSPTDAIGRAVCASGFISAKEGDILRIKGISFVTGVSLYVIAYDSNNAVVKYNTLSGDAELGFIDKNNQKYADGILEITLSSEYFSTGFNAIRFSGGDINESTIVTINEEIKENNPVDMTILQEQINANTEAIKTYETNILLLNDRMSKLEEVESNVPLYTNLLPTAEMGADQSTGWVEGKGYTQNARLSGSSGAVTTSYTNVAGECVSGYIPVNPGDIVRIKGFYAPQGINSYVVVYNDTTLVKNQTFATVDLNGNWREAAWYTLDTTELNKGTATITLDSTNFGTDFNALRFSGVITENTIITVNEEIKENNSGGSSTEEGEVDKLKLIREWDAPIYDANIPVFELTTEKAAVDSSERTPTAIYSKYDALMAKYPKYITKTNLGLCSDGVTPVYRYDFREPEPYHQSNMPWSETKTKAILASGIHFEWAGIYSLYYALEEIAENPKLSNLRRNTHFIVIPVINPYCTLASNYDASIGVLNANGVQIHRNFEVGFIYPGESGYVEAGNRNHGGIEPLSEVETQYVDNVLKENTDAAFFLTCHNYDAPSETNGISFIWPSTATKYMCNMGFRLIDKMSIAWLDKYSDELVAGIADYRTENVSDDFLRFGHAHVSKTDGTETRQATKYGIQGANVEVCHTFWVHGTKANPEPSMSSFTMSRGTETYINFLLTALGCYDYKDKSLYTT